MQEGMKERLVALVEEGLTFGDCVRVLHELNPGAVSIGTVLDTLSEAQSETEQAYVAAAQGKASDGNLEVDSNAIASTGCDDGAYVLAWVWVSNAEAGVKPEDDDEGESHT
jgi:hypothetical protein